MNQMKNGKKLAIKSGVRAGGLVVGTLGSHGALTGNHNEKLVRGKKLAIKSGVRAGVKQWGLQVGTG